MKKPQEHQASLQAAASDSAKLQAAAAQLLSDFQALHEAVSKHMEQTGHDLCWENDLELWKTIDAAVAYPHRTLPAEKEFEQRCKQYYLSRLCQSQSTCGKENE